MNLKTIAVVLAVAAAALIGYWAFSGAELFTLQQIQVNETDPLFGTQTTVWKDAFRPGLLDLIGPIAGGLVVAALVLLWLARRKRSVTVSR